ncbi:C-type lectin [Elysia marginata]|uniref:C-type lectin n=1 Tax=Elysia marginata TaxID=1093978 RepID=A0AAV4EXP3_9GAST|nr:C-type lectin [Elysia marginata]
MPGVKSCVFANRLVAYHETFAPLGDQHKKKYPKQVMSILWHEGISGRSAANVTSAFIKAISMMAEDAKDIVIWCDNCAAQNKNWTLYTSIARFMNSSADIVPQTVTLKYLETGHTFMSADSFHAQVETNMRRKKNVFNFHDFVTVEFIAKSKAYQRYNTYYFDESDIGIDDFYAFNTTCDQIPRCPPNSIHRNTINNITSCYTFHVGALSWKDAYHTCRKEGPWSALVSVESQQEQDYLTGVINADTALSSAGQFGFFTSGNDLKSEHNFVWTDTGSARPVKDIFENWHAHQPNNVGGVQDCLLLEYASDGYTWGDVDCVSTHPFICESSYTN